MKGTTTMVHPKNKGNRGEFEALARLQESGLPATRNGYRTQYEGAADLLLENEFGRIDYEVKRTEIARLPAWLRQVTKAAAREGGIPRILWRPSRGEWLSIGLLKHDIDHARIVVRTLENERE